MRRALLTLSRAFTVGALCRVLRTFQFVFVYRLGTVLASKLILSFIFYVCCLSPFFPSLCLSLSLFRVFLRYTHLVCIYVINLKLVLFAFSQSHLDYIFFPL